MAKIHEELVVIKLSKLIKDAAPGGKLSTDDMLIALQAVAEELAGSDIIVEIQQV